MKYRKKAFEAGLQPIRNTAKNLRRAQKVVSDNAIALNQLIQGDCIDVLNKGPQDWVDLVFADPPFNIGYLYEGYDDDRTCKEYLDFSRNWMKAVHRSLKPTGSFYLAIGDEYAADLCVIARRELGFHLRNWIIWHYTFGQQTKKKFAKSHTHILYFTKQAPTAGLTNLTFNADEVRVKSARQLIYTDHRANPKGKLPDDTWFLRPQEAAPFAYFEDGSDTWNMSRVCATFKEREGWHGCQMPIAVLDRIVKVSSNPGDIVLDPFNGSGTTVVSASMLDRHYVGIDQSAEYIAFAKKRLEHAQNLKKKGKEIATSDATRASKVQTATDAFGRQRVERANYGRKSGRKKALNGESVLAGS